MIQPTINDAVTIAGGSTGTMLANRYRVVRQLGSGGTGSVWLVEDVKPGNVMIAKDGTPYILETNTIPGMTETSLLPDSARHAGVEFPELCRRIVELALEE